MKDFTALKAGINIDKVKFVQLINQQVDKAITDLPPQQVDMGEIFLTKKGDLKFDIIGQDILLSIPLGIQFKGKSLLSLVEAQGGIELSFRTKVDFQPYWQLVTDTKLERYSWLDKPDVQVSILNFSVENMADQFLGKNKAKIEGEVDKSIADFWDKAEVATIAEVFFQKSHQLRPDVPLYLQLSPERIQLSPTETKDHLLATQLDCLLNIDLNSTPQVLEKAALPTPSFDLKEVNTQSDINHLHIGLSDYIDGHIEMTCLPIYEKQTNRITMQIQDFKMKATSFWKKSIVNLFSGRIKKEMEERLQYNLDDIVDLEEVKKLKNLSPQEGVRSSVDIRKVSLGSFIVGEKGIDCLLKAEVALELYFEP